VTRACIDSQKKPFFREQNPTILTFGLSFNVFFANPKIGHQKQTKKTNPKKNEPNPRKQKTKETQKPDEKRKKRKKEQRTKKWTSAVWRGF